MARVLVVDDDPVQADMRRLVLEHAGHTVGTGVTPAAAREAFTGLDPDIILLDLHLPRTEDGVRLIRWFRQKKDGVKILIMSGNPEDLDGRPELDMVDQVLPKPMRSATLLKTISKLA
jgi:DNA-binding response OmpR family regulator